jgi:hypothetical protein
VKFLGSYRLPWQIDVAGAFQSIPGAALTANYTASNAQVLPSLGRNLSAGAGSNVTVNLIEPGTAYTERMNQFDVRFARSFSTSRLRLKATVDLFNAFNGAAILQWNATYGTTGAGWGPQEILQPRMLKLGLQVEF